MRLIDSQGDDRHRYGKPGDVPLAMPAVVAQEVGWTKQREDAVRTTKSCGPRAANKDYDRFHTQMRKPAKASGLIYDRLQHFGYPHPH